MLAPNEILATAAAIFGDADPGRKAGELGFALRPVAPQPSEDWAPVLTENLPPAAPLPPVAGGPLVVPPALPVQSQLWRARKVRLVGRRGLINAQGALFLDGPVTNQAGMARAGALAATGGEGLVLGHAPGGLLMLTPAWAGERRLTGIGLHWGGIALQQGTSFVLRAFAALLLAVGSGQKFDYILTDRPQAEIRLLLASLGLGRIRIFDLDLMQGVICDELLVPVPGRDPAGWVDAATLGRLRAYAQRQLSALGSPLYPEPVRLFVTDSPFAEGPLPRLLTSRGYLARDLEGRDLPAQALLMTQASHIVTLGEGAVLASLMAPANVPVLDLTPGEIEPRVLWLAGAGRRYAVAAMAQAATALEWVDPLPAEVA